MKRLTVEQQFNNQPKTMIKKLIIFIIIFSLVLWSVLGMEYKGISSRGLKVAINIIKGILNPNLKQYNLTNSGVPYLLLETLAIGFLGTLMGSIIAIPFAFFSARNITSKFFNTIGVIVITFIRTFPAIIVGLMFIRVTGGGPFTGVLTLSITSIGMISKLYIEAIEDLDKGIIEALDASGCTKFQKIRYGIIPQLSTNFISVAIYRFEINIKDASILGLVGAGGIGAPIFWAMNEYRWRDVGAFLLGLIVLILVEEAISTRIRRKLATGE